MTRVIVEENLVESVADATIQRFYFCSDVFCLTISKNDEMNIKKIHNNSKTAACEMVLCINPVKDEDFSENANGSTMNTNDTIRVNCEISEIIDDMELMITYLKDKSNSTFIVRSYFEPKDYLRNKRYNYNYNDQQTGRLGGGNFGGSGCNNGGQNYGGHGKQSYYGGQSYGNYGGSSNQCGTGRQNYGGYGGQNYGNQGSCGGCGSSGRQNYGYNSENYVGYSGYGGQNYGGYGGGQTYGGQNYGGYGGQDFGSKKLYRSVTYDYEVDYDFEVDKFYINTCIYV